VASAAAVAAAAFIWLYPARAAFLAAEPSILGAESCSCAIPQTGACLRSKVGTTGFCWPAACFPKRRTAAARRFFRSSESESRSPQSSGLILSSEGGLATIDLGSLDGLMKGSELEVFRDDHATKPVGRLVMTTVFRQRARGRVSAGQQIKVRYQVRVPAAVYLGALLQRTDALSGQGDSAAARTVAEKAVAWAQSTKFCLARDGKRWSV